MATIIMHLNASPDVLIKTTQAYNFTVCKHVYKHKIGLATIPGIIGSCGSHDPMPASHIYTRQVYICVIAKDH